MPARFVCRCLIRLTDRFTGSTRCGACQALAQVRDVDAQVYRASDSCGIVVSVPATIVAALPPDPTRRRSLAALAVLACIAPSQAAAASSAPGSHATCPGTG